MNAKSITQANLELVRDTINQEYGNIENYLSKAMALKPEEIKQLKEDYLE